MTIPGLYHPIRIGNLFLTGNIFLAPVAGYSDRAFRSLCIDCGAAFTYTEMISAEALMRNSGNTEKLMLRAKNEHRYAVQLFGNDPQRIAGGAKIALQSTKTECIDINAGCPVPKVIKTGAGAALTRDPKHLEAVIKAVVQASNRHAEQTGTDPVPVTVKIRSGWSNKQITWREAAEAALSAGIAAITLHPRTKEQGYEGKADWSLIAKLAEYTHANFPHIPVIGSGDLFTPEAGRQMLQETGCDGIMFARGAMGNPFIFTQTHDLLTTDIYGETSPVVRMYSGWKELQLLVADEGEALACKIMRKRFCAYSRGIEGSALLRSKLVRAETVDSYRIILENSGFTFNFPD